VRCHLSHHVDLPRHTDQRVFRRLIAVARRIRGGTLDVRVVIRRAGAEVQNPTISYAVEPKYRVIREIQAAKFTGDLFAKNDKEILCIFTD